VLTDGVSFIRVCVFGLCLLLRGYHRLKNNSWENKSNMLLFRDAKKTRKLKMIAFEQLLNGNP